MGGERGELAVELVEEGVGGKGRRRRSTLPIPTSSQQRLWAPNYHGKNRRRIVIFIILVFMNKDSTSYFSIPYFFFCFPENHGAEGGEEGGEGGRGGGVGEGEEGGAGEEELVEEE